MPAPKEIIVEAPATSAFPWFKTHGTASSMETAYDNALWQYNSSREHDGLRPVKRFPNGTKFWVKN